MSLEKAKNLLAVWTRIANNMKPDSWIPFHRSTIEEFMEAASLIAASEQRERDAGINSNLIRGLLETIEPYMTKKPQEFSKEKEKIIERCKQKILNQDSQQNISSKKTEL